MSTSHGTAPAGPETETGGTETGDTGAGETGAGVVELAITGMTCASCANRIERKLNKLDGVAATVNYATEKAKVTFDGNVEPEDLVAAIEQAGYAATLPRPKPAPGTGDASDEGESAAADPVRTLRQRLLVSAVLTVPVVAMAMVPPLQFTNWQWLSLTLAAPVVVWGAWPFHKAAWTNLRHGTSTMDTLISLGTLAAFGWSLYALFWGTAGMPGMTHPFSFTVERTDGAGNIYLEAAAGVTTFILAGRYFEVRSKRQAGAALRALLELGAKDVAVLGPDGVTETRIPVETLAAGDLFVVRPGEKIATDGVVERGHLRGRRVAAHRRVGPGRGRSPATPSSAPPSTPAVGWSSAPPGSAPTPSSRRWRAWSRTHRTARPRSSAWPTGSPASSCRS